MAIAASGAVSFSDLRTEFVGGSSAISFSDLYRGGSNILSKAGDNPAVNLAASVPTSGTIDLQDFYSTAKGFKNTVSSSTTNIDANALFGDDYDVNYPKIIDINSGVTIGGNGDEAIDIPSGLASTLTINNAGTVIGFGGAAGGGAGGSAINCASSGVTINNTGQISGGGGGGGAGGSGGAGGGGSYTSTSSSTVLGYVAGYPNALTPNNAWTWTKAHHSSVGTFTYSGGTTSKVVSGHTFSRGPYAGDWYGAYYRITKTTTVTNYTSGGSGGSGGAGGVGQGYNQSAASGSSGAGGAGGGTNAGTGGTGGTGGAGSAYATAGANGSTGSTGSNGNSSNGSGGSGGGSGGAAGAAVTGTSVSMNNTGTLHGAVA